MSRGGAGIRSCSDILWFVVVAFMYSESGKSFFSDQSLTFSKQFIYLIMIVS